jgi:hypothetical protein
MEVTDPAVHYGSDQVFSAPPSATPTTLAQSER